MGITNVPAFLGGRGDISALLDHIDYVVKKFGADGVTIGTDNAYRSHGSAAAEERIKPRRKARPGWESIRLPDNAHLQKHLWQQPYQVQSLAWTNWPLFTVGLVQRGHSDEAIQKIIGGNLMRVARAAWSGSALRRDSPSI